MKILKYSLCIILSFVTLSAFAENVTVNVNVNGQKNEKERVYPKYSNKLNLVNAYMKAWENKDFDLMYHLLSSKVQEEITFKKFKHLLKEQVKTKGIVNEYTLSKNDYGNSFSVSYKSTNASYRPTETKVILTDESGNWFINGGGLIPDDMSSFDR